MTFAVTHLSPMPMPTPVLRTAQEKKKVDWGDVEEKAKREAMRLLEWRKQQVCGLVYSPHFPLICSRLIGSKMREI